MKDLSIIIVTYNSKDFVRVTLKSVFASVTKYSYEVIVYDSDSKDGTAEMIANEFPQVKLMRGENKGFGAGNNRAIEESTGRYLLLLNPDTEIKSDTLDIVADFLEKNQHISAATCKLILPSGKIDDACRRAFPTPWVAFTRMSGLNKLFPKSRLFNSYTYGYISPDVDHEIDWCAAAFFMVRKEVLDQVGVFDDQNFFLYGEDVDLCYRIRQAGYRIWYYPKTQIFHYKGHSTKTNRRALWEFNGRMMISFYRKHFEQKYPWVLTKMIYFAIILRYRIVLFYALMTRRLKS